MATEDEERQQVDDILDAVVDLYTEAESAITKKLAALPRSELERIEKEWAELGPMGKFIAQQARMTIVFEQARTYMDATGSKMATFPEIFEWHKKKGES